MNKAENYLVLQKTKRSSYILYIDVPDNMGYRSLLKYRVPVHFEGIFVSEYRPYKLVYCRVRNKYMDAFTSAMKDLYNSMLICGWNDVQEQLEEITECIQRSMA